MHRISTATTALCLSTVLFLSLSAGPFVSRSHAAPAAVRTSYHGVTVSDPFQWLESADDPAVARWTASQNRAARSHLDKLSTRGDVEYELHRLLTSAGPDYHSLQVRENSYFVLKFKPPAQQAVLITFHSLTNLADERAVLDPNILDPEGTTSIDFYEASRDGKRVAVSLSEKGSEAGTLYVYDAATGRKLDDVVPRVMYPTGGGSVAWNEDGSGFYYTRYPAPSERGAEDARFYQQVYFHKLGSSVSADRYEVGREFPRIAEIQLTASDDGRQILATVGQWRWGRIRLSFAFPLRPVAPGRRLCRRREKNGVRTRPRSTSNGPATTRCICSPAKTRPREKSFGCPWINSLSKLPPRPFLKAPMSSRISSCPPAAFTSRTSMAARPLCAFTIST
jgi:hypothetical protein